MRLTDVELIGLLVTRVTTELDARVDGPRWQIAAQNPIRLEAARQAAADGRRKAQAYAEGVGARLGELIGLAEPEGEQVLGRRRGGWATAAAAHDMPVAPREHEVAATIKVTFVLIS